MMETSRYYYIHWQILGGVSLYCFLVSILKRLRKGGCLVVVEGATYASFHNVIDQ